MKRIVNLAATTWLAVCGVAGAAERPNIVFIVTDDQAPWALGISGHPHARTPHMDRLFREGAYLVNAFTVTPVCSPSRASLMTSRYGSEVGITDWINPRVEQRLGLDPSLPVWPRLLADAGYHTALVGKWHLGTEKKFHPTQFGYQHFVGFLTGGTQPKDPVLEFEGKETRFQGYAPDVLVDHAIEFLKRESQHSFVLSLHFREPHAPWLPVSDVDRAPFRDLDPAIPNPEYPLLDVDQVKQVTREYLASVASVDRNLGRLLDELQKLGLAENTIVIYTSDHGYNMGHNGVLHKGNALWMLTELPPAQPNIPRGQRPNMYDNSLRVPTAVRWPGVVKPGTTITQTVSHLDWFPTILEMAGVEAPTGAIIRGRSLVHLLKAESPAWDNDLYAEYSTHNETRTHMRTYRTPEWKLVRDFLNPGRDELYSLKDDPAETRNVIDSVDPRVQEIKQSLDSKLLAKMREANDPLAATQKTSP